MTAFNALYASSPSDPNSQARLALFYALLLTALLGTGLRTAPAQGQPGADAASASPVHIAVVADLGPAADSLVDRIERETTALLAARRSVRFSVASTANGWSATTARAAYQRVHHTASVDAVLLVGPVSASAVCASGPGHEEGGDMGAPPTIAVSTGSGVLMPSDDSGLCTIVGPTGWPAGSFEAFQQLASFQAITVAVDARAADHIEGAQQRVRERAQASGLRATLLPMRDIEDLSTPSPSSAVFLDHVDRWSPERLRQGVDALTAHHTPTFAHDPSSVPSTGVLAAVDENPSRRARHVALAVESAVLDAPPPAARDMDLEPQLVINRPVARRLDLPLSWDMEVEARFVASPSPSPSAMTLSQSMRESISANLRLRAKRQQVAAQDHDVDIARARLLPHVRASATGTRVDQDVAAASFGSQPERSFTSSLSFRQVLFSESAFASLSVERRMQAMRAFEQQATRLDAAHDAAHTYLGVLRARAQANIHRENVQVARSNLRAARNRQQAGAADPREVTRLETQLARAEQRLVHALGQVRTSEINFNGVLDRPLDASVDLRQTPDIEPNSILQRFPHAELFGQPGRAEAFSIFWVSEALEHAPEVQAVDRLVSAQRRQLKSVKRSFWMPTISVEGALSQRVLEGGLGTSGPDVSLPNGSGGSGSRLPTAPDGQWSIGLTASFPLFQGTERTARKQQATDRLEASRTERTLTMLGVEQRVRTALTQLETAHAAVQRAQEAARAAQHTLEVTQAAYQQGTASVLDLIDAQRTAVTTRQEASNAAYDLLRDWMDVQRSSGSFRALRTGQEQAAFSERLQAALTDTGDSAR